MTERCPIAILAGGRATRLGAIAADRPKALVEVAGRPFIFHQLAQVRRSGFSDVVLCIGHRGEAIRDALGGGAEGVSVRYSEDPPGGGTAAALRAALPLLGDEFLVLYGDTYLRIDFADVYRAFRRASQPALLTVLRNRDRWETSNTSVEGGLVVAHDKREPSASMRWIDYGLGALGAAALVDGNESDLSDVYRRLAGRRELAAYAASLRFYEIGNPAALAETDRFLRRKR